MGKTGEGAIAPAFNGSWLVVRSSIGAFQWVCSCVTLLIGAQFAQALIDVGILVMTFIDSKKEGFE